MARITMTYELAMAAARDTGNRRMRAAGRTRWVVADWNHACETFARLWPEPDMPNADAQQGQGATSRGEKDTGQG